MKRFIRPPAILLVTVLTLGVLGAALVALAADPTTEAEYRQRLQKLGIDDIDGHLALARWCRDQEAYDLLLQECNYILSRDKGNKEAKLLRDLAQIKLAANPPESGEQQGAETARSAPGKPKILTDEQVQILRRKEVKLDNREPARRLRVKFDDDVLERFWNEFSAQRTLSKDARADFMKLAPGEKLKVILGEIRNGRVSPGLADGITIENDPVIFEEYIRRVSPIILNGCAASKCHGGTQAGDFTLYNERVMNDNLYYTDYLILHDYKHGDQKLINRDFPEQSLLVQYGLPADAASLRHPTDIPPLYRTTQDRKLAIVLRWIRELDVPPPDYGFTVEAETKP